MAGFIPAGAAAFKEITTFEDIPGSGDIVTFSDFPPTTGGLDGNGKVLSDGPTKGGQEIAPESTDTQTVSFNTSEDIAIVKSLDNTFDMESIKVTNNDTGSSATKNYGGTNNPVSFNVMTELGEATSNITVDITLTNTSVLANTPEGYQAIIVTDEINEHEHTLPIS